MFPNIHTSEIILLCIAIIIIQSVLFLIAFLLIANKLKSKFDTFLTKLINTSDDIAKSARLISNDYSIYTEKKDSESPKDYNNALSEMLIIGRDIRSILHDSRHLQNENLQTSYAIQSAMNETRTHLTSVNSTQDAVLRATATICIQSEPLINTYLNQLKKSQHDVKIDKQDHSERNIGFHSPTLLIPPINSKTAIISTADNVEDKKQSELCLKSHKQYSHTHGYAYYFQDRQSINRSNTTTSNIASLIIYALKHDFEKVFFVASSTMFTNLNISIDSLIRPLESDKACFIVTENDFGVDLTVFAIKNCADSKTILNLMMVLQRHTGVIKSDEDALNYLMTNYTEVRQRVYVERNWKNFNSAPREKALLAPLSEDKIWSEDDLICNFSGLHPPHLEALVKRYALSLAFRAGNRAEAIALSQSNEIQSIDSEDVLRGGTVSCSILGRWGQFGNQLFQIAAVFGYAKKYGSQAILPQWYCVMSEQNHGVRFPKVQTYYGQQPSAELFHETNYSYSEIPYKQHIDLHGSFQSERYFSNARDEIKELFSEPQEIKTRLDEFIYKHDCKIFDALHVRNYLHPTRDIGFGDMERLPEEYFIAAIKRIDDTIPLFVATDKRDFIEEIFRKTGITRRIVTMDNNDPLMDFYMLSRSRRLAISNSSFSWWSAYLGPEKEKVIAPHRYYWFSKEGRKNPHYDTRDLYPPNFEEVIM